MDKGLAVSTTAGLAVGIAFVVMFGLAMHDPVEIIHQRIATELPQVKLVVMNASNQPVQQYSGERGTYCWQSFGCGDTGILIPGNSISLNEGSIVQFTFLDSYHGNKPPLDFTVFAFDLNRDLEVIGATQGKIGGDVQIAKFDFGNKSLQSLSDIGNRNYAIDLADGDYILWAQSAWYQDGNRTYGDGDVSYFYRIHVS